ncbi:hypothetical protein GCM10014715_59090 [Streptomyces spiralis]|uniref:Uncharacterized protein n=1 Tax=Streptomyces spiralis TaxID=66376 RepID=A0A919AA92_9ACTN|nr:hypothetical protein GCM10014715_59090 [Streptomyces spiralis]
MDGMREGVWDGRCADPPAGLPATAAVSFCPELRESTQLPRGDARRARLTVGAAPSARHPRTPSGVSL